MARLVKANIPVSAKQAARSAENGTYRFDAVFQRSEVWEQWRKSGLIHSMIEGYPIPPFYAEKVDGKVYSFLDGKQRMNAIKGFINNEYYLIGVPEVEIMDDNGNTRFVNIDGFYFKDLPEEIQDEIKDYHLTIYYYENITPEQVRTLFAKLNNGKPLSTKERNIANCVDIVTVSDIGNHELFKNILTAKALEQRNQIPMVMKTWMMLNEDIREVSFESREFNEVMQETKMTDAEKEEVVSVLDKILAVYTALEQYENARVAKSVRKKMTSETHMISLVPWMKKAIVENVSDERMGDFVVSLFSGNIMVSDEYSAACKSGSAKNANIMRRHEELEKAWDRFFAEENKTPMPSADDAEDTYDDDQEEFDYELSTENIA